MKIIDRKRLKQACNPVYVERFLEPSIEWLIAIDRPVSGCNGSFMYADLNRQFPPFIHLFIHFNKNGLSMIYFKSYIFSFFVFAQVFSPLKFAALIFSWRQTHDFNRLIVSLHNVIKRLNHPVWCQFAITTNFSYNCIFIGKDINSILPIHFFNCAQLLIALGQNNFWGIVMKNMI